MNVSDTNVKVFCRVRPPNERERGLIPSDSLSSSAHVSKSFIKKCVTVPASDGLPQTVLLQSKHCPAKTFTFDRVFNEDASQTDVFEVVGAPITRACLEGYNGTIFAYGQTGSGKTFTMQGPDDVIDVEAHCFTPEQLALRGLVPRVFDYLFDNVVATDSRKDVEHTFACSFLEIYNERVYDLLDRRTTKDATGLQLRESGRNGVHVEGVIESVVTNSKKAAELMAMGAQNRRVGQTSMNRESSRSHSVFILQLQSKEKTAEGIKIRTSRFNLVDLAGSERQRSTDAAGERLKEAGSINRSLSALGNVILGLSEQSVGKPRHVHYRDSKLTFLLKDSLGGNSKTYMVATISPVEDSAFETLSTLKFAQRAKLVQNRAVVNEDAIGSTLFLQEEVQRLRRNLQQAHIEISRNNSASKLLLRGATLSESTPSHHSLQQREPCNPAMDSRFRELEEAFAASTETNERLQRSCEHLRLQNGNVHGFCAELKRTIAHLRLMLRLRGIDGPGVQDYKPSADAIEWKIKYDEVEERVVELENELQRNGNQDACATGKTTSGVESLNIMLLSLTRQLAAVLRDKHDLQDRLLENQSETEGTMRGSASQEAMDADFSARLEKALKQQANEYQAMVDSIASVNACLKEKATETALELHQMKRREDSWSIQQLDLEKQAADSRAAMLEVEKAHLVSLDRLVQEKSKVEALKIQLERTREGIRLKYEAVVADASTANKDLEDATKLLQQQLVAMAAELIQRDQQVQEAVLALNHVKTELDHLKAATKNNELQLSVARGKEEENLQVAARLRTKVSDRDKVIKELQHSQAITIEESRILQQTLAETSWIVQQLQNNAITSAQKHIKANEALTCQANEQEQMVMEDFGTRLGIKDEKLAQLHAELNESRTIAEETARRSSFILHEMKAILSSLQRQLNDHKQESKQALENAEQKLSKALADASKLSEEKREVELQYAEAVQQIDRLQNGVSSLESEKKAMACEIEALTERTEQLNVQKNRLEGQNVGLVTMCDQQQAQLSGLKENTIRLTREVEELQQQVTRQSKETTELRKDLASAQTELCQAAVTKADRMTGLSNSLAKIQELEHKLLVRKSTTDDLTQKLEKAICDIRGAESTALRQQEELKMSEEIQSTLRDELKTLECERLELTEVVKTEQDMKQKIEEKYANARVAWLAEKNQLTKSSQDTTSALEARVDKLAYSQVTLSAQSRKLELENEIFKTSVAKQNERVQELMDRVADREATIHALELSNADSALIRGQLTDTIAELRNSVRDVENQLIEGQNTIARQKKELTNSLTTIVERDNLIAALKQQVLDNEAAWDRMTCESKAELEASSGRVQALEQLIAEKTAVFGKAEKGLMAENEALKEKIEEREDILAQQTEQSLQQMKQVEDKVAALELANKSMVELTDNLKNCENASYATVHELQAALEDLQAKHQLAVAEIARFKAQETEVERRRREVEAAEERHRSVEKSQQAVVASAVNQAKMKAASHDVLGQVKRKSLTERVKLQREIQTLTKKLETVSKENEKLVGHHNSRQKIQHHAKVKEENNRLLEKVRQLSDDKFKLQRSLEKARGRLKEKENIGIESRRNSSPVSPASSNVSKSLNSTPRAERLRFESAVSTTTAKLARRRPTSPSASPGPSKKRVRTPTGPGWQR